MSYVPSNTVSYLNTFTVKLKITWFIFGLIGMGGGAGPKSNEPQTFKKISQQMLVYQ